MIQHPALDLRESRGYGFARFNFRGKNTVFMLVLAILMVPYAALLIPLAVWMNKIGLQNSLVGVGLVLALFQLPFATFMMRNAFEAVPQELEKPRSSMAVGSSKRFGASCSRPSAHHC